jgi:endo-1,4-beta-xylanase
LNDNATFRNYFFFKTLGSDYIKIAFDAATAADPEVKLYYNDLDTEFPGAKSTAALNIVKSLKAAGTKIDGKEFQSLFLVGNTPSIATQMQNMGAFTVLGVEVAVTELDISMKLPATQAFIAQQQTDDQPVAAGYRASKDCVGVTVWDFDDAVNVTMLLLIRQS